MDAIVSNISRAPAAISAGCSLVYQVTKKVGYDVFSANVKDCYNKRKDLGFFRTYAVKPVLFALDVKKSTGWNVFPGKSEAGMSEMVKFAKGLEEALAFLPVPFYKLFELMQVGVSRLFEEQSLKLFFYLPNQNIESQREKTSALDAFLLNLITGIKFSRNFAEGFSFISQKIFNNASLVHYAPRVSKLVSWAINPKVVCAAFVVSAFYECRDVSIKDVSETAGALSKKNGASNLEDDHKKVVNDVLKGIGNLFVAGVILSKIFNERVVSSPVLGFCSLVVAGVSLGAGILTDRWKFTITPPKR